VLTLNITYSTKHKRPSALLAQLVEQRFVDWEFSAGAVRYRTPVAALGGGSNLVTPSSARKDLATQCQRVQRENRVRMPALCIMCPYLQIPCAITQGG